jgi:type I restriction enzyme S subunit
MCVRGWLKPGWRKVKFGDVVRLFKARSQTPMVDGLERYVGLEHLEPGDLRIRRWGDIADGTTFTNRFEPGQVLFGKRRAYQRKVAVADFAGVCSGDIYVLESKDAQVLLPGLLSFICQTDAFFEHAVGTSAGSLSPRTNWASLANFEFALPPIEEQRRLVDILNTAYRVVECYRESLVAIDIARKVYLANRFSGVSGCPDASIVRLEELAEVRTGLALGKKSDGDKLVSRPYLRVANVLDGALDLSEIKTVLVKAQDVSRYQLHDRDVLMTEGGDFDKLGRGTVWRQQISGCLHQNHVFAVRPRRNKLLAEYLATIARSPHGKRYFLSCAKRTSNLASINKKQLSNFPVIWMTLDEQQTVVEQMEIYDSVEMEVSKRLKAAESFYSAVREATFNGS